MKRVVITLVTVCVLSLVAVAPTFADHWNNCGGRNYQGYGGYSRQTFYPGGYGGYTVPGRVVVGYRSVGGISGYSPYGGYSNYGNYNNFGYGNYGNAYGNYGNAYGNYGNAYGNYPNGGYGYNSTPSSGFYLSR